MSVAQKAVSWVDPWVLWSVGGLVVSTEIVKVDRRAGYLAERKADQSESEQVVQRVECSVDDLVDCLDNGKVVK